MPDEMNELRQQLQIQRDIEASISGMFASEDEGLKSALANAREAGLPSIQISPVQGKFLQLLATLCNARNILEIGSLAGYSGIWLARALPPGGRLITLEVNPEHASVVKKSFAQARVSDRAEVRVGKALDLLPQLVNEATFDLVFIDADKPPYPHYLDWALRLTRPGSVIVADNTIRGGGGLRGGATGDEAMAGVAAFNKEIVSNPRLVSLALAMDDDYTDGFSIAVVKPA